MRPLLRLVVPVLLLTLIFFSSAHAQDWRPINPEDLAAKSAVVEKDADAEGLFWEVRLDDAQVEKTVLRHYLRMKVFTPRGVESQSRIDIPYAGGVRIVDISARTVKPDGKIVELRKDGVFDRTIVKVGKIKVKAKSFAMPGVEPGAIIEYQWREERASLGQYIRLEFQREIPVRTVKYLIKPFTASVFPFPMVFNVFHMPNIPMEKAPNGFSSFTLNNVPAFKEEPYMPPESEVRPWILVYYAEPGEKQGAAYWSNLGKRVFELDKTDLKVNDDIKKAAAAAIGTTTAPEEKLAKLFEFVRTKVTNPYDDASGYRAEELDKVKENTSPADTLKRAVGTPSDIDFLFGALAAASGFEVRIARLSDRSDLLFNPALSNSYFLNTYDIAVKVGTQWKFFNPGNRYIPFGMLSWTEEGVAALIPDSKEPQWADTPVSPPANTLQKQSAKLRLLEDGSLEGDVQIEYTGHLAATEKERFDAMTAAEQEAEIREDLKGRLSTARISGVVVENAKDPVKPLVVRYQIKVPQYAQRTGRRLFFQPGYFQQNAPELFTSASRQYPIYIPFAWSEEDDVTIELPKGFDLENADAPASLKVDIASLDFHLTTTTDKRTLHFDRKLSFGNNKVLLFPVTTYPNLKQLLSLFHERDKHTMTLRETGEQPR